MSQPSGRIWFPGNPWQGGHALKKMDLWGVLSDETHRSAQKGLHLELEIQSVEYYSETPEAQQDAMLEAEERMIDQGRHVGDWRSVIVWGNYHACRISSNERRVLGTQEHPFLLSDLDGLHWRPDSIEDPENNSEIDFDSQAFHTYILGHDAVACHDIKITQTSGAATNVFDFDWTGRVANAYVGDYAFKHRFKVQMRSVPFVGFRSPHHTEYMNTLPEHAQTINDDGERERSGRYNYSKEKSVDQREAEMRAAAEKYARVPAEKLTFVEDDYCDWLKF